MSIPTRGFAAHSVGELLKPFSFDRRSVGPGDVHIKIKYCGVCHSDLHQVKDEWTGGIFPMVPGHEIVGIVEAVGKDVTKLKKGDIGAVGCYVDSCRSCEQCKIDQEHHCLEFVETYSSLDKEKKPTYGGYSRDIVVTEHFVCKVPESLKANLAAVAPLLCAGITTWTPMIRHGMNKPGKKIGVVGLGGLGHMAVKFGVAFGNEVTVISTSESKREQALTLLGATHFIVSSDPSQMTQAAGVFDYIIDTVSAPKDINEYLNLLQVHGVLVSVGLPPAGDTLNIDSFALVLQSKGVFGSLVGGMRAHQEMLDFCGEQGVTSVVEIIKMSEINEAFERMLKSDVRYRFVIDIENSEL